MIKCDDEMNEMINENEMKKVNGENDRGDGGNYILVLLYNLIILDIFSSLSIRVKHVVVVCLYDALFIFILFWYMLTNWALRPQVVIFFCFYYYYLFINY